MHRHDFYCPADSREGVGTPGEGFLFIDLRKAYDSVPREALWLALVKLGVPESTIQLVRSFHRDMQANVKLDGDILDRIDVGNGLRQGCCMAPVLFNLYACFFAERWRERVSDVAGIGITLKYKYEEKLFRRYTRNSCSTQLTELQFADDAALLSTTRKGAEDAIDKYIEVAAEFGLIVSIPKTKLMVTGRQATADDRTPILVNGGTIENVPEFTYLGSTSGRVLTEG